MFFQIGSRGNNEWWRYLLTFILIIFGTFIGQIPLVIVANVVEGQEGYAPGELLRMIQDTGDISLLGIGNNLSLLLMLLAFVGGVFGLWFAVRFVHGKALKNIITSRSRIHWGRITMGFTLWFGLTAIMETVNYMMNPDMYIFQFQPISFLFLLLIVLIILPFQTTFEELVFRGYLMQGFGLLFRNRWMPLILTSAGFGFMHILNPEIEQYGTGIMLTYYMIAGLVMGLMTIWDDGIELALGVHAATNIYAATMVTYEASAIKTDAIWKSTDLNVDVSVFGFLIVSVTFLIIVSRVYAWKDPLRLFKRIPVEGEQQEENQNWA